MTTEFWCKGLKVAPTNLFLWKHWLAITSRFYISCTYTLTLSTSRNCVTFGRSSNYDTCLTWYVKVLFPTTTIFLKFSYQVVWSAVDCISLAFLYSSLSCLLLQQPFIVATILILVVPPVNWIWSLKMNYVCIQQPVTISN